MRLPDLATEAWRNVVSGAARSGMLVLVTILVTTALAMLDMAQVRDVLRQAEAYRSSGAATYQILTDGAVDGQRCDALGSLDGAEGAGALRAAEERFVPVVTPRTAIPVFEVTPGVATILTGQPRSGVLLEADTAAALGARAGSPLPGLTGDAAVTATYAYPQDGRDQRLSYAMVRVDAPDGRYSECWLSLWPADLDAATRLLGTVVDTGADRASVRVAQLNPSLGRSLDATDRFEQRTGRLAWPVAFLTGAALAWAAAWLRRLELSYARHLGLARREVCALLALEATLVAPPVLLTVATICAGFAWTNDAWQTWVFGFQVASTASLGLVVGAVVSGLTVQERRVLTHLKGR